MRPIYRILADDVDVTAAVADRLLELVVIDEAGVQSDEARLTMDDRAGPDGAVAQLPGIGTRLAIALGYQETGVMDMGVYVVDELELRSPPATLAVVARAADMPSEFRSPVTRSWDSTTIGGIVDDIARRHGYQPAVDPDLAGIPIGHMDQERESDMAFLARLAGLYDAVAKPAGGRLVFCRAGRARSASTGQDMPVVEIAPSDVCQWTYKRSARTVSGQDATAREPETGGARAYWWDYAAGQRRAVEAGQPPYEEIRYLHATEAEARAAAQKRLHHGQRRSAELSLSLPGDPRLAAEARVVAALRPGIPDTWRVVRAEHRISSQGYVTQLDCERFAEEDPCPTTAAP